MHPEKIATRTAKMRQKNDLPNRGTIAKHGRRVEIHAARKPVLVAEQVHMKHKTVVKSSTPEKHKT